MGVAPFPPFQGEAFLWSDSQGISLGIPAGSTNSQATAISNNGFICGWHVVPGDDKYSYQRRSFFWAQGHMLDLGISPGAQETYAYDVNTSGLVVGHSNGPFIWQNGFIRRLQDLVSPSTNLTLYEARSINNVGQIAGYGGYPGTGTGSVAYILHPVLPQAGDCTCDWVVNVNDLLYVINNWGACPPLTIPGEPAAGPPCNADLTGDRVVNHLDLVNVIQNWSQP